MKLRHIVFFEMVLHLAVATPVYNNKQVKNVIEYYEYRDPNLWQKSGKVEGDMVLTPEQLDRLYTPSTNRNGVIDTRLRWPNKKIPYKFSDDFAKKEKDFIEKVLQEEYNKTCISVVPYTNETDYVYITGKNTGCWSRIGRIGGRQELNLERGVQGCVYYRTIVHELMHAVGFYHQHAVTERDDYVNIQWINIKQGEEHNFEKYGSNVVSNFDQPYDYDSIMHYDEYTFSGNGKQTIIPKKAVEIGKMPNFSKIDIAKISKMYDC